MFPSSEMAIEVFELAENEDTLSPVEMDPEKLVHKFKEVRRAQGAHGGGVGVSHHAAVPCKCPAPLAAPDQACCHRGGDPAAEEEGEQVPSSLHIPPRSPHLSPTAHPEVLCHAVPCCAIPALWSCHTIPCHAVPCCAIPALWPWQAIPCHSIPCHSIPCHAFPCHAFPCHAFPCHAFPCCSIPCCATPALRSCHSIPCHSMPCHICFFGQAKPSHAALFHATLR